MVENSFIWALCRISVFADRIGKHSFSDDIDLWIEIRNNRKANDAEYKYWMNK